MNIPRIPGTTRVEAFSDGVFAIIVTLLIFEIHVPALSDFTNRGVLVALFAIAPKFISFAVSFFTLAIFWVNHHHFFHGITHADWKLMWYNNLLLFWLCVVPFTTDFIGEYPAQPVVVALYGANLCLAAISFTLMGWYVFYKSSLLPDSVPPAVRRREWYRSWLGTVLYGLAALSAFIHVDISLALYALIPCFYVVPNLLRPAGAEAAFEPGEGDRE